MKIALGHYYNLLEAGMTAEELAQIHITPENTYHAENIVPSWDDHWMSIAYQYAKRSHDAQTKHGCVIVRNNIPLSMGYNGAPSGAPDSIIPNIRQDGAKYPYYLHSELNAIINAAKKGISIDGAVIYVTGHPCAECCKLLCACNIHTWIIGDVGHVASPHDEVMKKFWKTIYKIDVRHIRVSV